MKSVKNPCRLLLLLTEIAVSVFANSAFGAQGVRKVTSSSCKVIPVRLGIGTTTQIILEQEPKVTLYADKRHFKVVTNMSSPRSLAIIPVIETNELDLFRDKLGNLPSGATLASALDRNFKTNLFVFFDHSNQLMFELRFAEKSQADYILKVSQTFGGDCEL